MEKKLNDIFTTSDMGLCVSLICCEHALESLDKANPRKVLFQFSNSVELQKDIFLYWKNELLVEPQKFMNQIKNLKGRLYGN